MSEHALPTEWRSKPLGELSEIISGGTPARDNPLFWDGGGIEWVTPTDITNTPGRILFQAAERITKYGLASSSAKLLPKGAILMTSRATLGAMKIAGTEVCTNQGFKSLIPKSDVDNWFLYYAIQIVKSKFESYGIGTTFLEVNKADTSRLEIAIPIDNKEQQKIAKILTTVDNLIEKTEALIEKYQAIKQGMTHDLFTRGIDTNGQLRPSFRDAPHLYKQTELGWIPKEWEVRPLSDYFSYISYGFTNPMPETEEGPYMITAANVFGGKIQYETTRHTSQNAYDTFLTKKSRPEAGDLLLTKDGTLGRFAVVEKEGICINQSVAVFRPNGLCNVELIKFLLETETYQQKMLDDAGGSTIKHIYITVVNKMLIALPKGNEEKERLMDIIHSLNSKISDETMYLEKLKFSKKGLMQDLLTGKVRVEV